MRSTMSTRTLVTVATVALTSLTTVAAEAQLLEQPRRRQGYYLSATMLGGTSYVREEGESLGTFNGSTTNLRMGQLLTRRIGLGLQIDFGSTKNGTQTNTSQGLGLEGHFELVRNLAVHGGFGLGVMRLQDSSVKNEELRGAFGAQYNLALSYAWFPFRGSPTKSGGFALTPTLQARFIPGDNATSVTTMLGLDIGWWTGLPRNQLELPPEDAFRRDD